MMSNKMPNNSYRHRYSILKTKKMKNLLTIIGLFLTAVISSAQVNIEKGWEYWSKAEFEQAEKIAQINLESDGGKHLQSNIYYIKGNYEAAIKVYDSISSSYDKYDEILVNKNVIYFCHLKELDKAKALIDDIQQKEATIYTASVDQLIELDCSGTFTVPMQTKLPLNPFIPMVAGLINGQKQNIAFDTGGNYLIMPKSIAENLGVTYDSSLHFKGSQGFSTSKMWVGTVNELVIGKEVKLKNIPVTILEEMNTEIIIFGTNILKEFITTIDYPNNQFVFTTRDKKDLVDEHRKKYIGNKMSFIMWGDHYMMGKGKYNGKTVNMFFDSGLVVVGQTNGKIQQSWLCLTKENMELLNIEEMNETENNKVTPTDDTLEFAGTTNKNVLLSLGGKGGYTFGGIKCQLLVSHGVLKNYAWTIDFDNMEFMFK